MRPGHHGGSIVLASMGRQLFARRRCAFASCFSQKIFSPAVSSSSPLAVSGLYRHHSRSGRHICFSPSGRFPRHCRRGRRIATLRRPPLHAFRRAMRFSAPHIIAPAFGPSPRCCFCGAVRHAAFSAVRPPLVSRLTGRGRTRSAAASLG